MYWVVLLYWLILCGCILNMQEYDVLLELYNATNGPNWINVVNPWLIGDPCTNQWTGVTCDTNGTTVTQLLLNSNLVGSLPSSISKLSNLSLMLFIDNPLSGTIPEGIGGMSSLQHLFISNGRMTGTVPSGILQLTKLIQLSFRFNQLTGTIPSFGPLTSMFYMEFNNNQFTGTIPSSIGLLTGLNFLNLQNNSFSGTIPTTLRTLSKLQTLYMTNNNLCDACFRFNRDINTCVMDSTPPNCTCSYTPRGSSACPVNQTCLLYGCIGGSSGLGTCDGDNLLISNTILNERNNVSFTDLTSTVNGTVQLDYLSLTNSEVNINGNLIGNSSQLLLQNTVLRILENLVYQHSLIKVDVHSFVLIERNLDLNGSTLVINLTGVHYDGEYPLLNYSRVVSLPSTITYQNIPSCKSVSYQFRSHHFSVVALANDSSCGIMTYVIVGGACGGLLLIVLVVSGYFVYKNQVKTKESLNQLNVAMPTNVKGQPSL